MARSASMARSVSVSMCGPRSAPGPRLHICRAGDTAHDRSGHSRWGWHFMVSFHPRASVISPHPVASFRASSKSDGQSFGHPSTCPALYRQGCSLWANSGRRAEVAETRVVRPWCLFCCSWCSSRKQCTLIRVELGSSACGVASIGFGFGLCRVRAALGSGFSHAAAELQCTGIEGTANGCAR